MANGRLVVVAGTGTGIGKTFVAAALTRAFGRRGATAGIKPVESGVPPSGEGDDGRALREASTFHVKQPAPYLFASPVSPHLAAREAGTGIRLKVVADYVTSARSGPATVVLETAGGLFSPVAKGITNADMTLALRPDRVLLVAPDRLGVLHDVGATTRAAQLEGLRIDGIVLSASPGANDASIGRNASEIPFVTDVPVFGSVPPGGDPAIFDGIVARLFPSVP